MPKQLTFNQLQHPRVIIDFAQKVGDQYYPARLTIQTDALTNDGERYTVSGQVNLGNPSATPQTPAQLYNLLNTAQAGPAIANALKDVVQQAIDDDISA